MNIKTISSLRAVLHPFYLVALCFILLGYGCQKNEQTPTDPAKDKENPKDPEKPGPPAKVIMVPSRINSDNLRTEFKYEEETARLNEIVQSDGILTKFLYRPDGSPSRYERYKDSKIQQSLEYMVNKEGQIYKIFLFDSKDNTMGSWSITYDEEKRIKQLKKYGIDSKLSEEENISYDGLGNAISVVLTKNTKTTTMSTGYDERQGIYQQISYVQLLFLTHSTPQQPRTLLSKTNPLSVDYLPVSTAGTTYAYEYNSNNYPSSLQVKQGTSTEMIKITYKTIKPK
ncbi:hypothetical protein OQX61_11425 [Pedobacter sp. PLR]|uniref:hypothetical protein n=1 Tax=Pedobacter sp. PLR TaxID=2994465 RepID=UPI002245682D|nr:hypothetical protein [Pedobacter sp. PLR]MCX2451871.1 hypothetical protein [Pedobacter sp. PLR]